MATATATSTPRATPTSTRTILAYLDKDRKLFRVCVRNHKVNVIRCHRPHAVPPEAIWSGAVPRDTFGDFRADLTAARRTFATALRRWTTIKRRMMRKHTAPAFISFLKNAIKEHDDAKPVFAFTWPKEKA